MVKAKYQLIMPLRKYQKFPGNNRFWCCGALMSSRQVSILIFCAITIVVVSILYFAFDARFLIQNIKPVGVGVIFPVLGFLGLYFSLAFLFKTGCIDSGIVPRALSDEIAYMQSHGDEEPSGSGRTLGAPTRYKTVEHLGQKIKLKWCVTCNIWRPPRASHCGLCNNCYETFDHHCPAVGNCVARRNYRYFYLFLTTIAITGVYMMGCNVTVIVIAAKQMGFGNALKTYPGRSLTVIEFCVSGLAVISVSGLSCMHTWLIARMETTNEDIKGTFNPRRQNHEVRNPYRKGNCCLNFITVICGPFPPSLIDRRGLLTEEYLAALEEDNSNYGATSSIPKLPPEPTSPAVVPDPHTVSISMTPTASMEVTETKSSPKAEEVEVHVLVERLESTQGAGDEETQQLIKTHGQQH